MKVLIVGGGVIGTSIAYFLARRGAEPIVVERTGIACAASGKSGGFLARDWCDGTPLQSLARRSFDLHASLAEELGGEGWGYRRLETFGGHAGAHRTQTGAPLLPWLADGVTIDRRLGTPGTTAQVHPRRFTEAMMREAEALGAKLRIGTVTGLARSADGSRARGVEIGGEILEGDAVVIAMGPWSSLAARWLPLPRIFGLKGHSLVFETGDSVPPQALFLEFLERNGVTSTPEIFPRPDGTTYVCAISSETPVPEDPADVTPDPGALERLEALCKCLSPALASAKILAR